VFTLGPTTQATVVPIKRELFMCEDIPILMGSLEVQEHPEAHTLMRPSLENPLIREPLLQHQNIQHVHALMGSIHLRIMVKHFPTVGSIKNNVKLSPPTNSITVSFCSKLNIILVYYSTSMAKIYT
jgi:hypothetical protein